MRGRGAVSLWVRIVALATVAIAPFVPPLQKPGEGRAVIYVVDRSASVGERGRDEARDFVRQAWAAREEGTQVGLVAFDGRAVLLESIGPGGVVSEVKLGPSSAGTDLASALRLAVSSLPSAGQRRIVLLTDGRATRGDTLAEVARARAQGIGVDAVPVGDAELDHAAVTRVSAREARVAEGEPVAAVAEVRSAPKSTVELTWSRDGKAIETRSIEIDASGRVEVTLTDPRPGSGVHVYEARIARSSPERSEDSSGLTAVTVGGKPRALVLTLDGECPAILADALDKAGLDKRVVALGDAPVDAAALSAADLVVLADLPLAPVDRPAGESGELAGLPPRAQEALIEFAQKGGGVIVTGGAFGFAPEYNAAPIARMLPVEIEDQGQIEDPKVAMAIMLDRSGSMGAMVGTHSKIQLAIEASIAAASTLRPDDSLAIGSVDERTHWDQRLGPVSGIEERKKQLRTLEAGGGGIYVYTALVDAYQALKAAAAPVRHVILFSDTADSEEQSQSCYDSCGDEPRTAIGIAEVARKAGITTSVVGIGREEDSDTAFLRKLAAAAGGRFYLTGDGTELRRIFVSETRVAARSNLREGPVPVAAFADHPILAGIDVTALPPLGGFVEAKRRATADTALVTQADNKPILASWRYGLGKVVALTTDLRGDWKGNWASFRGAGQALRQMVRFALRRPGSVGADIRVAVRDRSTEVTVDIADGSGDDASPPASIEAFAIGPGGTAHPVEAKLTRLAPGRWVGRGRTSGEPFVIARVRDESGGLVGEALGQVDGAAELAGLGPDERAVAELARAGDGSFKPEPAFTLRDGGARGREPLALWPWLLLSAAALVGADLWLRRLGKRRAAFLLPADAPAATSAADRPAPVEAEAPIARAA
jgi:Ca-activated chloride channel homolog